MKKNLESNLNGSLIFKKVVGPLLGLVISFVIYFIIIFRLSLSSETMNTGGVIATLLIPLILISAIIILQHWVLFKVAEMTVNTTKFEETFKFTGQFGIFMRIIIKGFLLTLITFGIYGAWFKKNVIKFFSENIEYKSNKALFKGTGGKLFLYILLGFFIPYVLIIVLVILITLSTRSELALLVIYPIIFLLISALYSLMIKWFINFDYKNTKITYGGSMIKLFGKLVVELILCIITLGLFIPAAYIRVLKYILARIDSEDKYAYEFVGKTGTGYLKILGNTILMYLTLGVYFPWAYANIIKWILNNTVVEVK